MSELVTLSTKRLFEIRLLHHYWLDDAGTVFDRISDQAKRNARLQAYDMGAVLAIAPTASTAAKLGGLGCLFRETALGCVVLAPAGAVIAPDTVFEFIATVTRGAFFNYTALTCRRQLIYELYNPGDKVTYRYKSDVAVLSNLTGTARWAGASRALFLSREIPAQGADDQVESLVLSGGALLQLTSDSPSPSTQQLAGQATDYPVYVNQADAPAIVPPAGLSGAPARGVRLSADVTDDVFAVISLTAVRADDDTFSFVDGAGHAKDAAPIYQVRFKNRSTIWTYLDKQTGALKSSEPNPLPLTYFGNAGTKQKPSDGFVKTDMSGGKIHRLVSEIYV